MMERSGGHEENDMKRALVLNGIMAMSTLTRADSPPPVDSVVIRTEGLYVNGEPFFPVGIDHAAHWHYSLPEAGDKGFNLVTTHGVGTDPRSFRVDVDDAYANGMYAAASLTNSVWEDLERVEDIVMACRDAPGLLAWQLEHEPNLRLSGPEHEDTPHGTDPTGCRPSSSSQHTT